MALWFMTVGEQRELLGVMDATRGPAGVGANVAGRRGAVLPAWPAGPEASA